MSLWPDFDFAKLAEAEEARTVAIEAAKRANTNEARARAEIERQQKACFNQLIEFDWKTQAGRFSPSVGPFGATRVYHEGSWPPGKRSYFGAPSCNEEFFDHTDDLGRLHPKPRRFRVIAWGVDDLYHGAFLDCVEEVGSPNVWRLFIKDAQRITVIEPEAEEQIRPRRRGRDRRTG